MRLVRRLLIIMAVMAALFGSVQATALAAPTPAAASAQARVSTVATASSVRPDTSSGCGYSSGNHAMVCLKIVGGGLYVDDMSVEMDNISAADTDYFAAITGPNSFQRIGPVVYLKEFQSYTKTFTIDADVSAGTYTATLFQWNPDVEEWFAIASARAVVVA